MYGRNTKDGEKEQCTGKPFALQTASNIFVGQGDFDFFVHFENTASCMYARRHAGASQLRLMACVVALFGACLLCCLLRGLTVLYCAVLCLRCLRYGRGSTYLMMLGDSMLVYTRVVRKKVPQNAKRWEKKALRKQNRA